jgi:hypothetical protein
VLGSSCAPPPADDRVVIVATLISHRSGSSRTRRAQPGDAVFQERGDHRRLRALHAAGGGRYAVERLWRRA